MVINNANKFSNKEIVHLLRSIAASYLLTGKNRFRIIAYEKAADSVEHLSRELKDIWQEGRLSTVSGIGPSISAHLEEYFSKGESSHFNLVLKKTPATVFILMKIPSIGPKKAYKLVNSLKLFNPDSVVEDLKKACKEDRISRLESFGEKSQTEILEAIDLYLQRSSKTERMPLPYAFEIASAIIGYLKKKPNIKRVDVLGSLRRMVATIGDIDIAVQIRNPKSFDYFDFAQYKSAQDKSEIRNSSRPIRQAQGRQARTIIDYFINYPKKISVDNAGERKASIIVHPNIRIDLRVQDDASYGSMLQYFTGSKGHNIKLREYALKMGYSLSEYGIKKIRNPKSFDYFDFAQYKSTQDKSEIRNGSTRASTELSRMSSPSRAKSRDKSKILKFSNEEKFYNFLGLQYIPPELREGTNEIEIAKKNEVPRLVDTKEIKGDLHLHSSYNLKPSHDLGENSFQEIMNYAERLGYEYIGFADHNPKISGLDEKEIVEIMKKRKEKLESIFKRDSSTPKIIARNDKRVKYFIGLETDILPNGNLALPEKAIEYVDYLIVAVHSAFNLALDQMTKRVLKALEYPKVKILGHPTGRLLGKREGFELQWDKIFTQCKKKGIAMEINSWPERLDLPDSLVREAKKSGVKFVVNTDAHANSQMDGMFYGVAVARRGWCKKSDIINTLNYNNFKKWLYG